MRHWKMRSFFVGVLSLGAVLLMSGPSQLAAADTPGGINPGSATDASGVLFTPAPGSPITLTSAVGGGVTAVCVGGGG